MQAEFETRILPEGASRVGGTAVVFPRQHTAAIDPNDPSPPPDGFMPPGENGPVSWIRNSFAGRFIAMFVAMHMLAAAFCLPSPSSLGLEDTIAAAVTDHAGEPCGTPENDCHKALCHPALAAAVDTVAIEPRSQQPLTFQQSFAQFASGPESRPPLSISA